MNARLVALAISMMLAAVVLAGRGPASDDPFHGEFSRHSHLMEKRF
jgi:hypothetical protein